MLGGLCLLKVTPCTLAITTPLLVMLLNYVVWQIEKSIVNRFCYCHQDSLDENFHQNAALKSLKYFTVLLVPLFAIFT